MKLSVVMITKNAEEVVEEALRSIKELWNELLVADNESTDDTKDTVERYGGKIFSLKNKNLGERKQWLVDKAKGDWILVLDSDERVSPKLYKEIKEILKKTPKDIVGYSIPYQNYVFGKPVYWGGEQYSKIRFFRKNKAIITPLSLHEEVVVKGNVGMLRGVIYHHSFRTFFQLFNKFTRYAWIAAQEKYKKRESVNFAKLFLYGPHMFWARFVTERGYKDSWRGFILAFAFAYMEGLTYAMLLWRERS